MLQKILLSIRTPQIIKYDEGPFSEGKSGGFHKDRCKKYTSLIKSSTFHRKVVIFTGFGLRENLTTSL